MRGAVSEAPGESIYAPSASAIADSQLTAFVRHCERETGRSFCDPAALHSWSVEEYRDFWRLFLEWSGLIWEGDPEPVCTADDCESAEFLPNVRLNYVENLLASSSPAHDERTALVACHASGPAEQFTRAELRCSVRSTARFLEGLGIGVHDRVVAVAPNNAEIVIGALAAASLGASFSCAGPDMAVPATLSRFEQVRPTVLMAQLGRAGDAGEDRERVAELVRRLPALRAVIALDDGTPPRDLSVPLHRLEDAASSRDGDDAGQWARLPFNHPLFTMFTSGTTGPPKCIVHGAGGTLLEHSKEHRLHLDLGPSDRLYFHTSAAWMMWNWQLSALAAGSTIVLYDGPIDGPETLWRLVSDEDVTVFGTSPPYLRLCEESGFSPRREVDLSKLRSVLSTGSILHDRQYDWVRENVGRLPLQSISGGTDIIGCFVLGHPHLPVHRGMIQCRSLGMDVQSLPTDATPAGDGVGELVCRNPFPSRPLGFVGDDGSRFHRTYFEENPGVWTHGDLIEFDDAGQARMHGRSDGVLNVDGIRIGPAEIYAALEEVREVRESLAVERPEGAGDARPQLVLLVVLSGEARLDGRLEVRIRRAIARATSPAHVPDLIVQVQDLPRTYSGKRSERAAQQALAGVDASNREALENPGSLDDIARAVELAVRTRDRHAGVSRETDTTEARLCSVWESVLGVRPIEAGDDFFDLGGTSLVAIALFQAVHDRLGVDLPLSTLVYARTPAAMAAVIDGPRGAHAPPVVLLSGSEVRARPLFLVHSTWGDVLGMRALATSLQIVRPIYGLQARGLDPGVRPDEMVEEMAAAYVETVRAIQPDGPYAIGGYSFGGLVAFEMARLLRANGELVDWLGIIDAYVDEACLTPLERVRFAVAKPLWNLRDRLAIGTRLRRLAADGVPPWEGVETEPTGHEPPPLQDRVRAACWRAVHAYRPKPYEGSASFFYASGRGYGGLPESLSVWRRLVRGSLSVERIPGGHEDMLAPPSVDRLAARIRAQLDP